MSFQRKSRIGMIFTILCALINVSFAQITSSSITSKANNVALAINVPDDDSQDLLFHFQAPINDHSNWAGFGMGNGMNNALMFVIYRSLISDGAPTISPRIGTNHQMPTHADQIGVTEMAGSHITNGQATINFRCTGCRDWAVGKVDINSTSSPFFWALGPNNRLESNSMNAVISKHRLHSDTFTLDLKAATGSRGVPSMDAVPGTSTKDISAESDEKLLGMSGSTAAHAGALTIAFLILFPAGYLILRFFENVRAHYIVQSLAMLVTIVGIALGISISINESMSPNLTHPHQIIGLIVLVVVITAWSLGLVGHITYNQTQKKSPLMKLHRFVGPGAILLGFINGIVGLYWAGSSRWVVLGWVLIDLVVWVVISVLLFFKNRRKSRTGPGATKVTPVWIPRSAGYDKIEEENQINHSTAYDSGAQHQTESAIPLQNVGK